MRTARSGTWFHQAKRNATRPGLCCPAEAGQQRPQPLKSSPADFVGELVPVARYRKP